MPFPSSFFLEEDDETGSGYRVAFGPTSLPVDLDGAQIEPELWNAKDGFPILGGAYAYLGAASVDGLPGLEDIDASLSWDSPTLWVDLQTGQLLPHWAELDEQAEEADQRLLVLRPAVPLEYGHRYAVALRDVRSATGEVLPALDGFATLRDGLPAADPDLERQRPATEELIAVLESHGVDGSQLQLAWDFVTVSEQTGLGPLVAMRDASQDFVDVAGLPYALEVLEEGDCEAGDALARAYRGTATVPHFLNQAEPGASARLVRDDDGIPELQGSYDIPFSLRVPCSVATGQLSALPVQVGHGLFLNHTFIEEDFFDDWADREGLVLFALTWTGMSSDDLDEVPLAVLENFTNFAMIPERLHQGQVEQLLAPTLLDELSRDPQLVEAGADFDAADLVWLSSSQGSILGGVTVALSPVFERAVFNVPGMPYSLLLPRATLFEPFFMMLDAKFDGLDVPMLIPLMGMLWEPVESAGWAPFITRRPFEAASPARRALMVDAIGDASVSTVGARVYARALGAAIPQEAPRAVWGLDATELPTDQGTVLLEVDYGLYEPQTAEPPQDNGVDPHSLPLRDVLLEDRMSAFLRTGWVDADSLLRDVE